MTKTVLGTCGYFGSGQDTIADDLCKVLGFVKISLGDFIRAEAIKSGLTLTRTNLQNVRLMLDQAKGRDYVPRKLVRQVLLSKYERIIFTGIRRMEEYNIFHSVFDMKLVFVYVDKDIRYQRMLLRKEKKDASTIEQLDQQMMRELQLFDYGQLKEVCDYIFDFNMPLKEYQEHKIFILEQLLKNTFVE